MPPVATRAVIVAVALGGCSAALAAQRITPAAAVAGLPADSPDLPTLRVEPVVPHAFRLPVGAVPSPVRAGRWYVLEQGGTIVRFEEGDGAASVALFADLTDRVDTSSVESGLLGFAFDPAYERTGRVYVSSVARGLVSRLSRFTVSAATDTLDFASERDLFELQQPGDVHNGGKMIFGPDGILYLGLGDGAQGLGSTTPGAASTGSFREGPRAPAVRSDDFDELAYAADRHRLYLCLYPMPNLYCEARKNHF